MGALYRLYRTFDGWIQLAAVGPGTSRRCARCSGAVMSRATLASVTPSRGSQPRGTRRGARAAVRRENLSAVASRSRGGRGTERDPASTPTAARPSFTTRRIWTLGLVVAYEHPLLGSLSQFGHLVMFSDTPGRIAGPPPMVGEHTRDILAWAGYGPDAVDELKQNGVVTWPEDGGDYPWSC